MVYESVSEPDLRRRISVAAVRLLAEEGSVCIGADDRHLRRLSVPHALGGQGAVYPALFCDDAAHGGRGTVGAV